MSVRLKVDGEDHCRAAIAKTIDLRVSKLPYLGHIVTTLNGVEQIAGLVTHVTNLTGVSG